MQLVAHVSIKINIQLLFSGESRVNLFVQVLGDDVLKSCPGGGGGSSASVRVIDWYCAILS